jgi:hypothetical protein
VTSMCCRSFPGSRVAAGHEEEGTVHSLAACGVLPTIKMRKRQSASGAGTSHRFPSRITWPVRAASGC